MVIVRYLNCTPPIKKFRSLGVDSSGVHRKKQSKTIASAVEAGGGKNFLLNPCLRWSLLLPRFTQMNIRDPQARIFMNFYADGKDKVAAHRHDFWTCLSWPQCGGEARITMTNPKQSWSIKLRIEPWFFSRAQKLLTATFGWLDNGHISDISGPWANLLLIAATSIFHCLDSLGWQLWIQTHWLM